MSKDEYRICYLCESSAKERYMERIITGGLNLWWCKDAEWCRTRAVTYKLHDASVLQ